MSEARRDTEPVGDDHPVGLRTLLVGNDHDDAITARYLAAAGGPELGRVIVRPTPGGVDRDTLALDVLAALGKNPEILRQEKVGSLAWELARAWLAGSGVRDVVVDRGHHLPADRLVDLAELATSVGASAWLIWSSHAESTPAVEALNAAGRGVERVAPWRLFTELPARRQRPPASPQRAEDAWPVLPAAEFTTFLAACRRHLSPRMFGGVAELYHDTAERTDAWLTSRPDLAGQPATHIGGPLACWLRDEQLGPAPGPPAALITLRATQAALFLHGIVLRWDVQALGPDPAARLPGDLTPGVCGALAAMGRTDHAAAAALSLHLNHAPVYFDCWRCGDVAADGSTLSPPSVHRHQAPAYLAYPSHQEAIERGSGVDEIACQQPVRVPAGARVIVAAHLAYRYFDHAKGDDPFFVHPRDPAPRSPYASLREAIIDTCGRLNHTPAWMHRYPCRHGTDVGVNQRSQGWMVERGLSLFTIDPAIVARVPRRPRPSATGDET